MATRTVGHQSQNFFMGPVDNKCWLCGDAGTLKAAHVIPKKNQELFDIYINMKILQGKDSSFEDDPIRLCSCCHRRFSEDPPAWIFVPTDLGALVREEEKFQEDRISAASEGRRLLDRPFKKVKYRKFTIYQIRKNGVHKEEALKLSRERHWGGNPVLAIIHSAKALYKHVRLDPVEHYGLPDDVAKTLQDLLFSYGKQAPKVAVVSRAVGDVLAVGEPGPSSRLRNTRGGSGPSSRVRNTGGGGPSNEPQNTEEVGRSNRPQSTRETDPSHEPLSTEEVDPSNETSTTESGTSNEPQITGEGGPSNEPQITGEGDPSDEPQSAREGDPSNKTPTTESDPSNEPQNIRQDLAGEHETSGDWSIGEVTLVADDGDNVGTPGNAGSPKNREQGANRPKTRRNKRKTVQDSDDDNEPDVTPNEPPTRIISTHSGSDTRLSEVRVPNNRPIVSSIKAGKRPQKPPAKKKKQGTASDNQGVD